MRAEQGHGGREEGIGAAVGVTAGEEEEEEEEEGAEEDELVVVASEEVEMAEGEEECKGDGMNEEEEEEGDTGCSNGGGWRVGALGGNGGEIGEASGWRKLVMGVGAPFPARGATGKGDDGSGESRERRNWAFDREELAGVVGVGKGEGMLRIGVGGRARLIGVT